MLGAYRHASRPKCCCRAFCRKPDALGKDAEASRPKLQGAALSRVLAIGRNRLPDVHKPVSGDWSSVDASARAAAGSWQ